MKLVFPIFIKEEQEMPFSKRVWPKGTLKKIFSKLDDCILAKQCFVVQDIWVDKAIEVLNKDQEKSLPFYCLQNGYVVGIVTEYNIKEDGTGTVVVEMFDSNESKNVQKQYSAQIDLQIDFMMILTDKAAQSLKLTKKNFDVIPVLRLMNVDRQKEMTK